MSVERALTVGVSLLPSFAQDVIGVYNQDYVQLFKRARPIKAVIKEDSKVMEHPLETGATITDHRIVLPVEIELSLMLSSRDYREVYQTIKQIFLDAQLLIVQTRTGVYTNQLIASIPHEEDATVYDAITLAMKLKEALFVTSTSELAPRNPTDASTIKRGNINPTVETPTETAKSDSALFGYYQRFQ